MIRSVCLVVVVATTLMGAANAESRGASAIAIWNGFQYEWKEHPHRFSLVMSRIVGTEHKMGLKIGACPADDGLFTVRYARVAPAGVNVVTGSTGPIETSGAIDAWQSGRKRVSARLPAGTDAVAVVLQGIRFRSHADDLSKVGGRCDTASAIGKFFMELFTGCPPPDCAKWDSGWHFGGARVKVGAPAIANGEVSFDVDVGVRPAESPDPVNGGDCACYGGDWPKTRPTRYSIEVDYVVLAGGRGDIRSVPFAIAGGAKKGTTETTVTATKRVSGARGFPRAVAGLTGFSFEVSADSSEREAKGGRYVRALAAFIERFTYQSSSGTGAVKGSLRFSNKSALPKRWRLKASLDGTMVQVKHPAFSARAKTAKGTLNRSSAVRHVTTTRLDLD